MKINYALHRKIVYFLLVLSFGLNVYYFNEIATLRKIIRTNTDIKTDKEINEVVKDIQVYDSTGKLPDQTPSKPLDKLIDKVLENNKSEIKCDESIAVCK